YRMDLKTKQSVPVESGKCVHLNNDHLISVDGSFLAVSNNDPEDRKSRVYVIPAEGGEGRQVTPKGPSYLHGISPDGKTLAYCAERDGEFDIYVIPFEGGEEKQLTTAPGLNDGPEYSRDGEWIYFNSVRTGLMQCYRMRPDGSEQTQLTDAEANSWFPHISPDGKKVVFLRYRKGDVEPGAHPANKQITLHLMDPDGANQRQVTAEFGGQGTLNVNSWAPDSKSFAFVTYEL
ncbi:MAG: TolB family protein, partial [Clostridia bacterium]|nr:TolB family protein [Clostridia bacterium]